MRQQSFPKSLNPYYALNTILSSLKNGKRVFVKLHIIPDVLLKCILRKGLIGERLNG